MNKYLKDLNKIEFAVTAACTGRCIHCQNGDPVEGAGHIDAAAATGALRKICENYRIETVMTFGGEPLLYPDVVCAIHSAASEVGIGKRQLITNGYFSKSPERTEEVARDIAACGINDLLLSVDAFHQKTIPLEPVMYFAECALKYSLPIRLQPAWLVSPDDRNPYNLRTKEIIREFEPLKIAEGSGNVVFPAGNALRNLCEYFDENTIPWYPYREDPENVRTVSFSANGDVLDGNIYEKDILEIMRTYRP